MDQILGGLLDLGVVDSIIETKFMKELLVILIFEIFGPQAYGA